MSQQTIANPQKLDESFESEPKPIVGQTYWVQCEGYRTRATYTSSGKWFSPCSGKEVTGVSSFLE